MKIFKTIRFKITLSFTVIFAVILITFALVFYHYFSEFIYNDFDKAMVTVGSTIDETIREDSLNAGIFDELKETYIPYVSINDEFLEIINSSGNIIMKSEQLKNSVIPVSNESLRESFGGKQIFLNHHEQSVENVWNKDGIRIFLYPVSYNSQKYVIVIAASLYKLNSFLERIRLLLYVSVIISLLLSIVIGWIFSGKIYDPIEQLILKTENITPDNLESRLPVTKSDDVISRLATTLNGMLDRIENAFSIQRMFTSDASHELKTPLTILKGEIEVALSKDRTEAEYKNILENSLDEVNRLQMISENLLLLSNLEQNGVDLRKETIEINELLTEAVSKISPLAKDKNINIRLTLDDSQTLLIMGNRELLLIAFLNLLDNAIKYSGINSEIECGSRLENGIIFISIKDNGNGINPNDLDRIFDRFYRSDTSRTRNKSAGYGLGLAIVKAIIKKHEGKISVTSRKGVGSIFLIKLLFLKSVKSC